MLTQRFLIAYGAAFVIVFCSVALQFFDAAVGDAFRYERSALLSGEVWRVLTGHLDHLSWEHLGLNAIFLLLVLLLFDRLFRAWKLPLAWVLISLQISLMMLVFSPALQWYVGLSGSLYGLLLVGLCLDIRYLLALRVCVIAVLIIKIVFEQLEMNVSAVSEFIGGPVAVDSHMFGLIAGANYVLVYLGLKRLGIVKPLSIG